MSGAYLLSLMTAAVNGPYQLAAVALLPLLAAFLADAQRRRAGRALFNQPPQSRIANTTIMVIAVSLTVEAIL